MKLVPEYKCNYPLILEEVREFIESDYKDDFGLEEIASKFSISKFHCTKISSENSFNY